MSRKRFTPEQIMGKLRGRREFWRNDFVFYPSLP